MLYRKAMKLMCSDLTADEIDILNEIFKNSMINPKNKVSFYEKEAIKFFEVYKSLHKKGYIRITPRHLLEMTVEEVADANIEGSIEYLDKIYLLYEEYKKKHTS